MAHSVNYNITDFDKIWDDIRDEVIDSDLAFANLESPLDTTLPVSSYPNFNMSQEYAEAAVSAGFNVFSLCNNHTNDQGLHGITQTLKVTDEITEKAAKEKYDLYFSGLRREKDGDFSYNIINKNGWKILFLPITEILNRPTFTSYINYLSPTADARGQFIDEITKLKEKTKCDLFILSIHSYEPEYIRKVSQSQDDFYTALLNAGVDIVYANHTHLIRDRKVVVDTNTNSDKLVMYGNGNIISGQRTSPNFDLKWPNLERDNTGDGILYKVTLSKEKGKIELLKAETIYITTYINTAWEFVIKKMDDDFVKYLYDVERNNWAKYIERRMLVNEDEAKDLIEWQ